MRLKLTLLVSLALILSSPLVTQAGQARLTDGSRVIGSSADSALASSSGDHVSGLLIAQAHRSAVTTFVRTLLAVSDRENDKSVLATEIRRIAEIQKTSEPIVTEAIQKTVSRSALKSFFFGGDYENIDVLRSEMIRTRYLLNQLEDVLSHTMTTLDTEAITAQILALEKDQVDIQAFINAHEDTAGFFGWFGKLF